MWTFLLDIDGTLLKTHGAGLNAIKEVVSQRYGVRELPDVTVHGRTDHGIWHEILAKLEIQAPESLEDLISDYCQRLDYKMEKAPGVLLPGVLELMKGLKSHSEIAVGLLTGNAKRAAEIKMARLNLQTFVDPFGGFGDCHSDRNDVARAAAESAVSFLGPKFSPSRCVVIGDTTNDVRCARAIGAKVIAVCTGGQDRRTLLDSSPDLVLDDLTRLEAVLDFVNG